MKKVFIIITTLLILSTQLYATTVSIPWSTSYVGCADWTNEGQQDTGCDGLEYQLDNHCPKEGSAEEWEEISIDANNPTGDGGKGQIHWIADGENMQSGSTRVDFANQTELWIRYYFKYPLGFKWTSNFVGEKQVYINQGGTYVIPHWYTHDRLRAYVNGGDRGHVHWGWDNLMVNGATDGNGHKEADGQWHYLETYILAGASGAMKIWVDGVLRLNLSGISMPSSFYNMVIGSNQKYPDNCPGNALCTPSCVPMYYDDIAISDEGYIGPIAGTPPTPISLVIRMHFLD